MGRQPAGIVWLHMPQHMCVGVTELRPHTLCRALTHAVLACRWLRHPGSTWLWGLHLAAPWSSSCLCLSWLQAGRAQALRPSTLPPTARGQATAPCLEVQLCGSWGTLPVNGAR